ncbi:MAG: uL15 family ribosomal protein [Clostridia bacterium]|nr:uL15 family ribosomal protein [Clostridia bacterium]
MPQAIGSEYSTLSNILYWISIVLTVLVFVQLIHFIVLVVKMYKRHKKKKELYEEREEALEEVEAINEENAKAQEQSEKGGEKLMSLAGLFLLAAFPTQLLVVCVILALECGALTFSNAYITKQLQKPIEEEPVPEPEPIPEPEPEPVPAPAPVVIPVVAPAGPSEDEEVLVAGLVRETITIEEAHNAIPDDVAAHFVEVKKSEEEKKYAKKCIINIDILSEHFATGETVNLDTLKAKGLLPQKADFVKVLARGMLDKALTVEAQDFSADAIKMIILTGGKVIKKA